MAESNSKESKESKASDVKYVRYIGTADVREISKSGWNDADVTDQNLVRWSVRNGWKVPQSEFSEAALNYLETDNGFALDS